VANRKKSGEDIVELTKYLATYLLSLEVGAKLLNVRQLAQNSKVSTGSISRAINSLEENGAISINRRGRLGSFLENKSLAVLWHIIEDGPMVIAMTPPSFPKVDGLATALYCLLHEAGIKTYLIFIRGSYNRLQALRNGICHAAVTSVVAAEGLCGRGEEILVSLPPGSFITDHRLFYKQGPGHPKKIQRVGIDYDSYDIKYLTELEFADMQVEYHQVTLLQIGRLLQEGQIDAAIWNSDHMKPYLDPSIGSRPLSPQVRELIGDRDTSAAIIVRSKNVAARLILAEILNPVQITQIQSEVIKGELVPRY